MKKNYSKKLQEESQEVVNERSNINKLQEELADVLEVFETILQLRGIPFEQIKKIQQEKNRKK